MNSVDSTPFLLECRDMPTHSQQVRHLCGRASGTGHPGAAIDDNTSEPAAFKAAHLLQMADEQGYQGLAEASNRAIVRRIQSNHDNGQFLKQLADLWGSSGLKPSVWCAWAAQQALVPVV